MSQSTELEKSDLFFITLDDEGRWFQYHKIFLEFLEKQRQIKLDAETIANGINVSVESVATAGILESGKGKVRILRPEQLPEHWSPETDENCTVWEVVHHLIRLAETSGDTASARVLSQLPTSQAAEARQLCYRLSTISDQNGWSQEAQAYNQLINNWSYFSDLATNLPTQEKAPTQTDLDL